MTYRRGGKNPTQNLNQLVYGQGNIALARSAQIAQALADEIQTAVIDLGTSSAGAESTTNRGNSFAIDPEHPYHRLTLGANLTLTTVRSYLLPQAASFQLLVTQGGAGSYTITWPSSVKWPAGTAPTLTTTVGRSDLFEFTTFDFGVTWMGRTIAQNYSGV